jgi:hypothetical protein
MRSGTQNAYRAQDGRQRSAHSHCRVVGLRFLVEQVVHAGEEHDQPEERRKALARTVGAATAASVQPIEEDTATPQDPNDTQDFVFHRIFLTSEGQLQAPLERVTPVLEGLIATARLAMSIAFGCDLDCIVAH